MKLLNLLFFVFFIFNNTEALAQRNLSVEEGTRILKGKHGLKLNMEPKKSTNKDQADPLVGRWNGSKATIVHGEHGKMSLAYNFLEIKKVSENKYSIIKHSTFPDRTKHEHDASEYVLSDGILIGVGSTLKYSGVDSKLMSKDQVISVLGNKLVYNEKEKKINDVDSKNGYLK